MTCGLHTAGGGTREFRRALTASRFRFHVTFATRWCSPGKVSGLRGLRADAFYDSKSHNRLRGPVRMPGSRTALARWMCRRYGHPG
nr:PREDICTED: uncharacterized protein LOC103315066 isoform X2 [Tribolium castaneum]|eukprot:XP_015840585.1 PREDICTED: uncharacterized protein LOC103315066 isoform X2 [Tribolium castaneum]